MRTPRNNNNRSQIGNMNRCVRNLTESPTNHVKSVSRSTEIGTDTAQILRSGVVQNRILQLSEI